jgi:hypothetical protein
MAIAMAHILWKVCIACGLVSGSADPVVVGNGFEVTSEVVKFLHKSIEPRLTASKLDLARAQTKKQSGAVAGKSVSEIAQKINRHLERNVANLRDCAEFSHEELNRIVRKLWPAFNAELQKTYEDAKPDGRLREHSSLNDYEKRWLAEVPLLKYPDSALVLREAKCAEVLMLWVHHVPEDGKKSLQDITLPRLPEFKVSHLQKDQRVASRYATSFSCVSGHNMQASSTSDHKWPHWPAEAHYHGRGHGAYPFWMGPSGSGGTSPIEVWWSEKQHAEKFYHESCAMDEAGYSKNAPCYHLMIGTQPNPTAYLYTAKEDFCCVSGPTSSGSGTIEKLTAPQSDFMDSMTDMGDMDFKGDFYSGKVKYYLMTLPQSEAVRYFWYLTTPEGKPVEQGEGGKPSSDDKPSNPGQGILIWHEYNTSSFEATTLDSSVFAIPDICKNTYTQCAFP